MSQDENSEKCAHVVKYKYILRSVHNATKLQNGIKDKAETPKK